MRSSRKHSIARKQRRADDRVTEDVARTVLLRDRQCVASKLGFAHLCRDAFGREHSTFAIERLTLDHVQEGYGRMGRRAASDEQHLVALCFFAHITSGWATSHRPELRDYLARVA